jgi:hypothetical protein
VPASEAKLGSLDFEGLCLTMMPTFQSCRRAPSSVSRPYRFATKRVAADCDFAQSLSRFLHHDDTVPKKLYVASGSEGIQNLSTFQETRAKIGSDYSQPKTLSFYKRTRVIEASVGDVLQK